MLLAGTAAVTHIVAALPINPARVLASGIAVALNHAGVLSVGAKLRATKTLHRVRQRTAGAETHHHKRQAKQNFSDFHLYHPHAADSMPTKK